MGNLLRHLETRPRGGEPLHHQGSVARRPRDEHPCSGPLLQRSARFVCGGGRRPAARSCDLPWPAVVSLWTLSVSRPHSRVMLEGRDVELVRLGELLAELRNGHGRPLLLRGEPGIGKTALLDAADGAGAATTSPSSAPRVCRPRPTWRSPRCQTCSSPVLDGLAELPAPQADALRGGAGARAAVAGRPAGGVRRHGRPAADRGSGPAGRWSSSTTSSGSTPPPVSASGSRPGEPRVRWPSSSRPAIPTHDHAERPRLADRPGRTAATRRGARGARPDRPRPVRLTSPQRWSTRRRASRSALVELPATLTTGQRVGRGAAGPAAVARRAAARHHHPPHSGRSAPRPGRSCCSSPPTASATSTSSPRRAAGTADRHQRARRGGGPRPRPVAGRPGELRASLDPQRDLAGRDERRAAGGPPRAGRGVVGRGTGLAPRRRHRRHRTRRSRPSWSEPPGTPRHGAATPRPRARWSGRRSCRRAARSEPAAPAPPGRQRRRPGSRHARRACWTGVRGPPRPTPHAGCRRRACAHSSSCARARSGQR